MFPRIFALESTKDSTVECKFGLPSVDVSFRRPVRDGVERKQWNDLCEILDHVILSSSKDRWYCDLSGDGEFRVKEVRSCLDNILLPSSDVPTRWVSLIPIKINIFAWRARLDRLPTRSNLACRGIVMDSVLCWVSFGKRPGNTATCYTKPLDSLKNWNDRFFWVDAFACPASFPWNASTTMSKDPFPKSSHYNAEHYATLVAYPAPFHKYPEPFLCLVGISRYYTLDENTYPQFLRDNNEEMDLLAFIRTADPTKVRIGERQRGEDEPKLLVHYWSQPCTLLPGCLLPVPRCPIIATVVTATADVATTTKEAPAKPSLFAAGSSSAGGTDPVPCGFSDVSGSDFLVGGIRTVVDPEFDLQKVYVLQWSVTNGSRLDHGRVCRGMLDEFAPPKFFTSIRGMEHDQLFTEFNVGVARQISLSAKTKGEEIDSLNAQLLLKEAKAAEAIHLRVEASRFRIVKKSLRDEVKLLKERNAALEEEKGVLDVKVADLTTTVKVREQEATDSDALLTNVKLQNDSLVDQVR
ncbi:hypothetical protein Tco_0918404, partial [Tanacetum coccineum]